MEKQNLKACVEVKMLKTYILFELNIKTVC